MTGGAGAAVGFGARCGQRVRRWGVNRDLLWPCLGCLSFAVAVLQFALIVVLP